MVSVERASAGGGLRVVAGKLAPGGLVAEGRYRLLEWKGTDQRTHAQLWVARDGRLHRDVALTVLTGDPADTAALRRARRTLNRAAHTAGIGHPGVAAVLNALSVGDGVTREEGILGLVVAEWSPGDAPNDLVAERPVAIATACRLLEPLAAAVEQAHRRGVVLGADPSRVRVGADGTLRLAFPGPPPQSSPRDDVRGLGATLYLLITGRFPGKRAPTPRELRPEVPLELSEATMRTLAATAEDGIRTSATLLQVLRRLAADPRVTEPIAAVTDEPGDPDSGSIWITKRPLRDPVRRRKLAIAAAALVLTSMAVFTYITASVADYFTADSGGSGGPSVPPTTPPTPAANLAPQQNAPITPASVTVFNVRGDTDGATQAARAVDGDPQSGWRTDTYFQQFPVLKPGIGLIVSFPQAANPSRLTITSPSPGTEVEIRTAPSADARLDDTTVVGKAALTSTSSTVDLHLTGPTQHLLIWITRLAGSDRHYQSTIAELSFAPAGN